MNLVCWLLLLSCALLASSDPCRRNFGNCDRRNGLCWGTGRDTHFCTCKAGYERLPSRVHSCVDIDECKEDSACPSHSVCENSEGSYTCTCTCGFVMDYTGTQCLDASKIDGLCMIPTSCYYYDPRLSRFFNPVDFHTRNSERYMPDYGSTEQSYYPVRSRFGFRCQCETGFEPNPCGDCEDINECFLSRPCTGAASVCVNTEGSYYCGCTAGYVLGPCRKRCYRQGQTVPLVCGEPNLSGLDFQGFTFDTYKYPIILPNWRTCADGVRQGQTTREEYDIDEDGERDLILTWTCVNAGEDSESVLKAAAEEEAKWGPWSCWTACKATCWGGLQTRVRKCLHGLPGLDGCKGRGTEKKECYKGPKCKFRIRKDATRLTRTEKNDLVQAMEKYKADTTAKGFFNAAAAHGWPNQCDRRACCPHGAKMKFLAWHRTILLNYEEGLSRYLRDKTLGIPYWNWLADKQHPPDIVWDKTYNNRPNPFANMTVLIDRTGPMRTIQRGDNAVLEPLQFAYTTWENITRHLMKTHNMHEFAESLEAAHGGPHVSACETGAQSPECEVSLAVLAFAGFDPLFLFHHSQVDRLWAVAQKKMEDAKSTTWSVQTALEALEEEGDFGRRHMPFGNKSLNSFPIVQAVNTMRDSYYYKELTGIKYDTLQNDGFPRALISPRFLRKGGAEVLYIGHYMQSVEETVYINYYVILADDTPCRQLTEDFRVGSNILQGTKENRFHNSIPRMTPMEKVGFSRLDIEFNIKACYTATPDCQSECTEVNDPRVDTMPDPILIHYLPNQPIDVYKFDWSAGKRMPSWYINLDAGSQWVFFFGDRTTNIRQVRTVREWVDCNGGRGRKIPCHLEEGGSACILPSGIYFLVDSSRSNCRAGLKLLIVARK